jgi:transcriptional regulator with PAS, ATPase and Fis domain
VQSSIINVSDLPDFLQEHDHQTSSFSIRAGMTLAEVEKILIHKTLTHATDNREKAAEVLGISRRALQYKLKNYGLL